MERREGMRPQFLQIEGPVALEEGRNFYDQPPFSQIFSKIAEREQIDPKVLRKGVSSIAKELAQVLPEEKADALKRFRYKSTKYINAKVYRARVDSLEAVMTAVKALDVFPNWDLYIANKLESNTYKLDGDYCRQEQSRDRSRTPSYGAWLENRMTRNASIQSAAIRSVVVEAFPQQFGQQDIADASNTDRTKPMRKRWQILKASGIMPSR